jgi:hypothetical protein
MRMVGLLLRNHLSVATRRPAHTILGMLVQAMVSRAAIDAALRDRTISMTGASRYVNQLRIKILLTFHREYTKKKD